VWRYGSPEYRNYPWPQLIEMLVPMAGMPTNIVGGARCVSSARRDLCRGEEKSSSLPRPSPDMGSLEKIFSFVPRTLVYKLSICEAYRLGKEKIQYVYCSEFGSHRHSNRRLREISYWPCFSSPTRLSAFAFDRNASTRSRAFSMPAAAAS
jgi:hypothetical protein